MKNNSRFAIDLNLPVFGSRPREHWPSKMSWADAMRTFAAARARYMREFDSPAKRLRDKNPEPFRLQ
ncbi:MAG: hypothetical protein H0X04_03810 [Chthoniobacterales bacterium]|nr:hypothetical protein [Chthoniobacterales bacterium]